MSFGADSDLTFGIDWAGNNGGSMSWGSGDGDDSTTCLYGLWNNVSLSHDACWADRDSDRARVLSLRCSRQPGGVFWQGRQACPVGLLGCPELAFCPCRFSRTVHSVVSLRPWL